MQKWCPESLINPDTGSSLFEKSLPDKAASQSLGKAVFRPESGYSTDDNLLRSLTRDERAQVAKLIEHDLRLEFEERRQAEAADQKTRMAAEAEILAAWQESLSLQLHQAIELALTQLARRISEFAVLMASKIVRREVEQDQDVLVRNLETILYKSEAGCSLTVTVHPEDAAWLETSPQLRDRCRIKDIKKDRRLDRGGCLVHVDEVEWDATISRQLAVLGEILAGALSVQPTTTGSNGHA